MTTGLDMCCDKMAWYYGKASGKNQEDDTMLDDLTGSCSCEQIKWKAWQDIMGNASKTWDKAEHWKISGDIAWWHASMPKTIISNGADEETCSFYAVLLQHIASCLQQNAAFTICPHSTVPSFTRQWVYALKVRRDTLLWVWWEIVHG